MKLQDVLMVLIDMWRTYGEDKEVKVTARTHSSRKADIYSIEYNKRTKEVEIDIYNRSVFKPMGR